MMAYIEKYTQEIAQMKREVNMSEEREEMLCLDIQVGTTFSSNLEIVLLVVQFSARGSTQVLLCLFSWCVVAVTLLI